MKVEDLVFLDESGVRIGMARTHARSPRGTRAIDYQPKARGQNMTIIGALGTEGMVAAEVMEGGMKKVDFLQFFEQLLPLLKPGQAVVMDNLRSHHAVEVKAMAAAHDVVLIYLPPYSPEFNPIEESWSKLKAWLRKLRARTVEALFSAIESGLDRITPADVLGWTRHSGYAIGEAQHG